MHVQVLDVTDGVMVARGDLGIEIPAEKVFLAQKMMISKCQMRGKPIICATQMLETMTTNPRPTRAEVSDVANAVLDGAVRRIAAHFLAIGKLAAVHFCRPFSPQDCVMLSGETAKGAYPTQTVDMMSKICRDAEMAINYDVLYNMIKDSTPECGPDESVACAAVKCATEQVRLQTSLSIPIDLQWRRLQNAKAIITMTTSGRTARLLAKYRPACPILPVSKDERSARQVRVHDLHRVARDESQPETRAQASRMRWNLCSCIYRGAATRSFTPASASTMTRAQRLSSASTTVHFSAVFFITGRVLCSRCSSALFSQR